MVEDKDTMSFRILHSSQEDNGKTIVRMSTKLMRKFQIDSGDILKISGYQTAHAICLPLDICKTAPKDLPEITFLNDHGKNIPTMFASDAVSRNLMMWSDAGSKVTVRKAGLSSNVNNDNKTIIDASKVVFATTPWFANNMGENYQKRIDFEVLLDTIVAENDRITVPINTGDDNRPQHFSSLVLDVRPESQDGIWMIRKNTEFKFADTPLDVFSRCAPPRSGLHDLVKVIPIVQKIAINQDIQVTVPSLEIYENGSKINIYVTERLHEIEETMMPDFHTGKEMKMKRPVQRLQGIPQLNMDVHDNLGNSYSVMSGGGGGNSGASFPSREKDWEFYSTSEISILLMPLINPDAKQITITIKEIMWEDHMHMRLPPTKPPHMTRMEPNQTHLTIAAGPWEFDIPIV